MFSTHTDRRERRAYDGPRNLDHEFNVEAAHSQCLHSTNNLRKDTNPNPDNAGVSLDPSLLVGSIDDESWPSAEQRPLLTNSSSTASSRSEQSTPYTLEHSVSTLMHVGSKKSAGRTFALRLFFKKLFNRLDLPFQ